MAEHGVADYSSLKIVFSDNPILQIVPDEARAVVHKAEGHVSLAERHHLWRMRVNNGHHVRPGFVNLPMKIDLLELIVARTADGLAVKIVFNDVFRPRLRAR